MEDGTRADLDELLATLSHIFGKWESDHGEEVVLGAVFTVRGSSFYWNGESFLEEVGDEVGDGKRG